MTALDDDQSMGGNHHQQQATPAAARADGGQEGAIAAAEVEQMSEDEERAEVEATNAPSGKDVCDMGERRFAKLTLIIISRLSQRLMFHLGQCCSDEEGPRNPCPATAAFLSKLFIQYPESSRKAYMAILFLWASILGIKRNKGVTIRASASTLPIGAGLGSSAALAVATAAAVLRLKYMREGNELSSSSSSSSSSNDNNGHTTTSSSSSSKVKARPPPMEAAQLINSWAYAAETLLHGHPSGLDNTVSCFGSAVQFRRSSATPSSSSQSQQQETANNNNTTKKCEFSSVQNFPPLRVLLTNTCVPRETKALVAHVSQLKEKLPGPTIAIMDAMEAVSQEFLSLIQQQHHQCPSQQKGGNGEEEEGREGPMTATAPAAASRKEEDDEEKTSDKDRRRRSSGGHEGKEDIVLLTSELIEMAHALLNALGVGHTKLDVICRETHKCGYSSKLTGAGKVTLAGLEWIRVGLTNLNCAISIVDV